MEAILIFFNFVTDNLIKDKEIEDNLKGFKGPRDSRVLLNQIKTDIVDTLIFTVKNNYPNLSHRYYKLKAQLLRRDKLKYRDLHAPIFNNTVEKNISWDDAKQIILKGYGESSLKFKNLPSLSSITIELMRNQLLLNAREHFHI